MGWKQDRHHLYQMDAENAALQRQVTAMREKIPAVTTSINIKRAEYARINGILTNLINKKTAKHINKTTLDKYKSQLETHQQTLKFKIQILEQELDGLTQYTNLQRRNQSYYDKEYNRLYTKVVVRNQLKHTGYVNRNGILNRTLNRFEQKYSNMHTDSEYQTQHNDYFITINAIFWWVYYLLFIITFYQIVYIQTDMSLIIKIRWLTVLLLFPLLYYVYDLVIMKI